MDKLKLALGVFFVVIAVVVGVVAVVVLANNGAFSVGLGNLFGGSSDGSKSILASNFVSPSIATPPNYNEATGAFDVAINFTNPINTQISVEQFSTQIMSKDNGTLLGNITLPHSINIPAAGNALIDVTGNLDPVLVEQLKEHSQDGNVNVVLENVNAVVNGITLHFDRIDLGNLNLSLGT
jgi:hypothetical protein